MSCARSNPWIDPAIRIAGAGLGAAIGGPLGGALGGWLGGAFGAPAAAMIQEYARRFGEKAGEKLFDVGTDTLADSLKESSSRIQGAYRQALRKSLQEVYAQIRWGGVDDWFANWEICLAADVPLNLSAIEPGQLVPEKLNSLFQHTMERLDAQGDAIRRKDVSLNLQCRSMPDALFSELTARLPYRLEANFSALILTPEYDQAWKETQLLFQQFAQVALQRIQQQLLDLASLITQQIAGQAATKMRKTWRGLAHLQVPMAGGINELSDRLFLTELFMSLSRTFRHRPYTQFTGILRHVDLDVRGQVVSAYYLLCHQIEFCEAVRSATRRHLQLWNAKKQNPEAWEKAKQDEQRAVETFNVEWKTIASFDLSRQWMPLEFIVDSAKKVLSIESLPLSLDPSDYGSGITSTSELLRFLASFANVGPVAFFGDAAWYNDDYSLLKVWADLIDHHRIDIDRVRINAEDYEEWDYLNSAVDLAIKQTRKGSSPDPHTSP